MVVFKNRFDAGKKLASLLAQTYFLKEIKDKRKISVVSLLRGGVVVGQPIAEKFNTKNLPLPVAKISSPQNQELAVGAFCFSQIYWKKEVLNLYFFPKEEINKQLEKAKQKFFYYCQKFNINEKIFDNLKNKTVILVDDGIATGATVCAVFYFLKTKKPQIMILAAPVGPSDFKNPGFDKVVIYHKEKYFSAISQFYEDFSPVETAKIPINN